MFNYGRKYRSRTGFRRKAGAAPYSKRRGRSGYAGSGGTRGRRLQFRRKGGYARQSKVRRFRSVGRPLPLRRKAASSRFYLSPAARAATAFKNNPINRFSQSEYLVGKSPYGQKQWILLPNCDAASLSAVLEDFYSTTDASAVYLALRNVKTRVTIRNLSTYAMRVRVTTWICRNSVPNGSVSDIGPPAEFTTSTLVDVLQNGFQSPYIGATFAGAATAEANDVTSDRFMNPLWLYYFKAIKTKRRYLKPYQELSETIHQLKRRPGVLWSGGNAGPPLDSGDISVGVLNWQLATSRSGGITTVVKTIELVGEMITDDTMLPNTVVFNAPVVFSTQLSISYDCAPLGVPSVHTGGDPDPPLVDSGRTGQRTNYMQYGGASGTDPAGSSSVLGALTSGI